MLWYSTHILILLIQLVALRIVLHITSYIIRIYTYRERGKSLPFPVN